MNIPENFLSSLDELNKIGPINCLTLTPQHAVAVGHRAILSSTD